MRPPPMPVSRRAPPNLGQALQEAVTLQQQGRLREAEKIYTRVLKALPDQFDALNLLGTIKAQRGQAGEDHHLGAEGQSPRAGCMGQPRDRPARAQAIKRRSRVLTKRWSSSPATRT